VSGRWLYGAVVVAALATPAAGAAAAQAAPACVPSSRPISALEQIASGVALDGKQVGAGWDAVVLGTITEVRHRSPAFRYRITMHVDSVLGPDLPALYTFFGSSKGTYPFEVGKVYAVPLARRSRGGVLLPSTELWLNACDPVVLVADLPAAHEIIARTKPGYTPSPSPSPTASAAAPDVVTPSPTAVPATEAETVAVPAVHRAAFPDERELRRIATLGMYAVGALALVVALAAAAESWWSRRHYA
jgi:hypothetical protein